MSEFNDTLTESEVEDLTGAKAARKQAEVLSKNGIYFVLRADGKVRTTWHHIHHPMKGHGQEEPDFSAING